MHHLQYWKGYLDIVCKCLELIAIILIKQAHDTRICNIFFLELWLKTAPGDFCWWARSWHCSFNLLAFGPTRAGWEDLKEKATVSQNINNVCKDLPGFLCTRTWIFTSILGMKDAVPSLFHFLTVTQGRLEAGKKERISITPLLRRWSYSHQLDGKPTWQRCTANPQRSKTFALSIKRPSVNPIRGSSGLGWPNLSAFPLLHDPLPPHPRGLRWRRQLHSKHATPLS